MEDSSSNSKNIQEIADLAKVKEELVDHLMTLDNNDPTNVDSDAELNKVNSQNLKISHNVSGGRAVIYKLFEKDGDKATCKICSKVLTVTLGSTTSLRRHAANFHECEWNQAQGLSDLENSTSSEINVFTSSPSENSKSKRSSFNGRALIYELFEKISEKEAQCKICYVVLKITRGSTTDIRHHALRYHESEWQVIQENANLNRRSVKSKPTWGRALVYKLFKKQGDLAKCRICAKVLSALDGNTTTMRRHATRFHEAEWTTIQNSTTEEKFVPPNNFETEGFESSDDNEYHTSNIQGIDNQDMFEADVGEEKLECEPVVYYDNDEDEWPTLMDDEYENNSNSILVNNISHNKVIGRHKKSIKGPKLHGKAIIHQLYEKHDNDRAKCRLCFKVFNTKRGNTTTMRRHAASKHPEEWLELQREAGEVEPNDQDYDDNGSNYYDIDHEPSVEMKKYDNDYFEDEEAETKKKSKSRTQALIYQIFEKMGTEALCRICHKVLNTARGNTSTIRRHAERAHPRVWNEIQAKNSQQNESKKSKYVEVKEENVMDYHLSPDSFMFVDQDEEEDENENNGSSNRKRALIYRLFEKQSDGRCMCVLCSKILSSTHGSTSALRRHASSFHWAEWEFLQSEAAANEQPSPTKRKRISPNSQQQSPNKSQALIYKIFNKETESNATCKLCDKTLSIMHGGTTTLRRHASSFHEDIWKQIQTCGNINDETEPPSSLEVIPMPKNNSSTNDISIKKGKTFNLKKNNSSPPKYYPTYNGQAIIYKLFEKQGEKAQCNICFKVLSALQGSTSTLRRHAARFHTDQWNEILAEAESQPQTKSTGSITKHKQKLSEKFVKSEDDSEFKSSSITTDSHLISYFKTPDSKLVVKLESKHDHVSEEEEQKSVESDGGVKECDQIDALDNQDQLISLISEDQNANNRS